MNGCGTYDGSEIYEGPGPAPDRKEKDMTKTTNAATGRGFERWRERQAERASDFGRDDVAYAAYLDLATGERAQRNAGVPESGLADVGRVDLSEGDTDDVVYERFRAELDGSAARRRTEEATRREREDRIQEHRRHARECGYPMPQLYDDGAGAV